MNVLTTNGITKHYKSVTALENVSITVPAGSVYGILGPNGSGKTTLLGIVTGVIEATAGTYRLLDGTRPRHETRRETGTLLETANFYPYLSARQNLEVVAAIKRRDPAAIPRVLRQVDLIDRQHDKFRTFSLGMKQRLAIAAALLASPRVVILDEPTNGLDPEGISATRQLIRQMAAGGATVILASHLLDEVEKVCTRVAILRKGVLLAEGEMREVLARHDGTMTVEAAGGDAARLASVLREMNGVDGVEVTGDGVTIACRRGEVTAADVNRFCIERGIVLERLVTREKKLESTFLELTR
ncbi:MAG: ABC transporter ATP-binding protein [Odoribacteraceae bacterium]|jgi:ABC-2 type transport system ATP-binding protein|nr:ABC transporter ATP-binding protein [Odoribacteraceae bacterium]